MYDELEQTEQIRIAVEFVARGQPIPRQLQELLGEDLTALIQNPIGD